MFSHLFAEGGLSLNRVKSLLEVAAAGSIVKAADGDSVKQSQYSRQIKELEDFFQVKLMERHGKGIRLTANGRELARISRFFLLGVSNFRRGCLTEEQTFRIGASATFTECFLLPLLAKPSTIKGRTRFAVETVMDDEIERRLHDLTLDFAIVTNATLSRPLQVKDVGEWRLKFWVPKTVCKREADARSAFAEKELSLAFPERELAIAEFESLKDYPPFLLCSNFLEALTALRTKALATFLPDFLAHGDNFDSLQINVPEIEAKTFCYRLAWNPRLLRLNPHAVRKRDFLAHSLCAAMRQPLKSIRSHRKH
jgi:DNA-binding transcriptional LysR family regulator